MNENHPINHPLAPGFVRPGMILPGKILEQPERQVSVFGAIHALREHAAALISTIGNLEGALTPILQPVAPTHPTTTAGGETSGDLSPMQAELLQLEEQIACATNLVQNIHRRLQV